MAAQSRDEYFDGVRIAIETLRVDVFGQFRLRHDAAAMMHQVRKHAELVAGELDRSAVNGDARAARIDASTTRMTTVRINVARSELMLATPILAKIAVSAANTADIRAQMIQVECGCMVI